MAGKAGRSGRREIAETELGHGIPAHRLDTPEEIRETLLAIRSAVLAGTLDHTVGRMLTDNVGKAASSMKNAKEVRIEKLQGMLDRIEAAAAKAKASEVSDRRHMNH